MIFFKAIKRALVKEALNSIDVSKPVPVGKLDKIGKSATSVIKPKKRTVITDVIENPEAFLLEAWVDKNEINVRVKRRFEYDVEQNTVQDAEVLK